MSDRQPWKRYPALLTAAATILVALVVILIPRDGAGATAATVLRRAARHLERQHDVELKLTFRSPALELVKNVLGQGEEEIDYPAYRLTAKAPNLFLLRPDGGAVASEWMGFDGRSLWTWKPDRNEVEVTSREQLEVRREESRKRPQGGVGQALQGGGMRSLENLDVMRFLSWAYILELTRREEWVEVTTKLHREAGRRAFRIDLGSPGEKEGREDSAAPAGALGGAGRGWVTSDLTLTIDPSRDLIESLRLDVKMFQAPVLQAFAELANMDQGVGDSFFTYQRHAPEGVAVVESPPATSGR